MGLSPTADCLVFQRAIGNVVSGTVQETVVYQAYVLLGAENIVGSRTKTQVIPNMLEYARTSINQDECKYNFDSIEYL